MVKGRALARPSERSERFVGRHFHGFPARTWTNGVALALIVLHAAVASAGEITCKIEQRGKYDQKVIIYKEGGKIYALNGQARQRAEKRGWVEGKTVFEPIKLQELIDEGLKKCEA